MNGNFTIDTNILIYAFGSQGDSKKSVAKLVMGKCNIINLQAINETIFVLNRKFNFSFKELNSIVNFLKESFLVKNIDIFSLEYALLIMEKYQYSYWDSMMIASSVESGCSILFSEDMQHNQIIDGKLKIINPFLN